MDYQNHIGAYFEKLIDTIEKLDIEQINDAMREIEKAYKRQGTIYIFGNGGSAATASHIVCDFNKGISDQKEKKFNVVCLNDNIPTITAIANDIGYEEVFRYQLQSKLKENDLVIAISGSGNSQNILLAAEYAKSKGIPIVALCGYDGGKLKQIANYCMHVNINDMQITEDIHMIFDHMMMRIFCESL